MDKHLPCLALAALAMTATSASAQITLHREDAIEIRQQLLTDLDSLNAKLTALANAIPEDKYSWRPGAGVRSVGEVFMHVAHEFYTFMPMAYGAKPSSDIPQGKDGAAKFEQMSSKADVLKALAAGPAYAKAAIAGADPSTLTAPKTFGRHSYYITELSFDITDDVHEHLGQLIAYARMNGIVPPWSKTP